MEPRGCNQWQSVAIGVAPKRQKQAETVAVGRDRLPIGAHGKEGSTVRVRQRALQKPRMTELFRMCSVGVGDCEGPDGAVYGAFASRTAARRLGVLVRLAVVAFLA